ncbi:unnamed protein product, partial [Ectocarpus sp. 8 AP-2014]
MTTTTTPARALPRATVTTTAVCLPITVVVGLVAVTAADSGTRWTRRDKAWSWSLDRSAGGRAGSGGTSQRRATCPTKRTSRLAFRSTSPSWIRPRCTGGTGAGTETPTRGLVLPRSADPPARKVGPAGPSSPSTVDMRRDSAEAGAASALRGSGPGEPRRAVEGGGGGGGGGGVGGGQNGGWDARGAREAEGRPGQLQGRAGDREGKLREGVSGEREGRRRYLRHEGFKERQRHQKKSGEAA